VAEVVPEPVRPGIHPGLPAAARDHLADPVRGLDLVAALQLSDDLYTGPQAARPFGRRKVSASTGWHRRYRMFHLAYPT
jgi:hypothetical protein